MQLDYSSLLIAVAVSSFSILVAALASWSSTRKDNYLVVDAIGVALLMIALTLMGLRDGRYDVETLLIPFTLMHVATGFIYAGVLLFLGRTDLRPALFAGAGTALVTATATLTGLLGLTYIGLNIGVGFVLLLCAYEYARSRHEFRSAITANAVLFFLTGLSFIAPGVPTIFTMDLVTYPAVDTLLNTVNAVMSLVGITGIGALTLTLHFSRVASKHHADAQTDSLTGVLNRRALFERFAADSAIPGQAVLVFDLDHFKSINDQLGHSQGDMTLRCFGDLLRLHLGDDAVVARTGGEEFCAVLPLCGPKRAREMAEAMRLGFAALGLPSGRDADVATVSVGMATGGLHENFESVLNRADAALYVSKRAGRNKLSLAEQRRAA